jgi:1-acyl-sn-glycerol-3-phosphate acyltransferase
MIGRLLMRATGWKFDGAFPDLERFVAILAPHTSNWDFFVAFVVKLALGIEARWIGKHTLFRWPVAGWLKRIGGIPVDRRTAHGVVDAVVSEFSARPAMVFVLAPEGTRKRVAQWRSGYWHVARAAGVPIVIVGLDYAKKRVVIGPPLATSESLEADERRLHELLRDVRGKRPENEMGSEPKAQSRKP